MNFNCFQLESFSSRKQTKHSHELQSVALSIESPMNSLATSGLPLIAPAHCRVTQSGSNNFMQVSTTTKTTLCIDKQTNKQNKAQGTHTHTHAEISSNNKLGAQIAGKKTKEANK